MISVSQKCQYALRAVFELGTRPADKPVSVDDIAAAQAIPPRFLDIILNQLRREGLVESRRGLQGGYVLKRPLNQVTVGDIVRLIEGPIQPVKCVSGNEACPFRGKCPFMEMWQNAAQAMQAVFDSTTLQQLLDKQNSIIPTGAPLLLT